MQTLKQTAKFVKANLRKKLDELPVNDAYALLEKILTDFRRPQRYTELTPEEILEMGKKPMTAELAQRIKNAQSDEELQPLMREHITIIYEHRCRWIDYLHRVTDEKPI